MTPSKIVQVAPLRYGVIFKKAFCDVEIFNGFVRDILGMDSTAIEKATGLTANDIKQLKS